MRKEASVRVDVSMYRCVDVHVDRFFDPFFCRCSVLILARSRIVWPLRAWKDLHTLKPTRENEVFWGKIVNFSVSEIAQLVFEWSASAALSVCHIFDPNRILNEKPEWIEPPNIWNRVTTHNWFACQHDVLDFHRCTVSLPLCRIRW